MSKERDGAPDPIRTGGRDTPTWAIPGGRAAEVTGAFVQEIIGSSGAAGVVVGLSGGIDSSVAAAVAVRGLGAERVLGVLMPLAGGDPSSEADAREVAGQLGIRSERVEITPMVEAFRSWQPDADRIRAGNVMARVRMIVLYDISQREGRLVLGTGNRSEWLLGYTTLHGDAACALNPIGQLYKTEVRLLAAHLELPESVRSKPPSAGLWQGQQDEQELGFSYAEADRLLHHLVDEQLEPRQLATLGFAPEMVQRIGARLRQTAFKRQLPPMARFPGRPHPEKGA